MSRARASTRVLFRRPRIALAIAIPLLALGGCSSIHVYVDYPTDETFDGLETWSWLEPEPEISLEDPLVDSELVHGRIRAAIENEMSTRGFVALYTGSPDFWIRYIPSVEHKHEVETVRAHEGALEREELRIREYDEGSLVIDVLRGATKKLIWRGIALAEVHLESSPERKEARINEAVRKILERFPPEKG